MTVYGFSNKATVKRLAQLAAETAGGGARPVNYREPRNDLVFRNDSGELVPARAVMRVTGVVQVGGRDCFTIVKPTTTPGLFVFNGPHSVAASGTGKYGTCFAGPEVVAKKTGTVNNGDELGITGWALVTSGTKLIVIKAYGSIDTTTAFVNVGGGETGGTFFLAPSGGIPAAASKFVPTFVSAQRYKYNGSSIIAYTPPLFEQLGNYVLTAIGANKLVQAKKIDGSWFVDVEPCE